MKFVFDYFDSKDQYFQLLIETLKYIYTQQKALQGLYLLSFSFLVYNLFPVLMNPHCATPHFHFVMMVNLNNY